MVSFIDVAVLNRFFSGVCQSPLDRVCFVPRISKIIEIRSGPSASTLAANLFSSAPYDLADILGLFSRKSAVPGVGKQIVSKIPIQFTLDTLHGQESIGVFVNAIDTNPDVTLYPNLFKRSLRGDQTQALITGYYVRFNRTLSLETISLADLPINKCVIGYDLGSHDGRFAEVIEETSIQVPQMISNLQTLHNIICNHFVGGFIEHVHPDGSTTWGYISARGTSNSTCVSVDACLLDSSESGKWKYDASSRNNFRIFLIGIIWNERGIPELSGDAFLSSDGTIMHSFYISKEVCSEKPDFPENWREGYYFNRFYPPNSNLVPAGIIESFNADMPEDFKEVVSKK